jgi:hypothetical protein
MADITQVTDLEYLRLGNVTTPTIRLANASAKGSTSLTFDSDLEIEDDSTAISKACILGFEVGGKILEVYIDAGGFSDKRNATITTRPLKRGGLDLTTAGDSDTYDFDLPTGTPVKFVVSEFTAEMYRAFIQGEIASGANNLRIGDETDSDINFYAQNADANKPFFGYDAGTSQWVFSDDGTSTTPFGTGAGVTGGDGITVTAGDIDVDTSDTTVFVKTSSGAGDENKVPVLDASGELDEGFMPKNLSGNYDFTGSLKKDGIEITPKFAGDGSDGDLSISSGTTTLTAVDNLVVRNYDNLTISGSAILDCQGQINIIRVRGTLTMSGGTIRANGTGGAGAPTGGGDGSSGKNLFDLDVFIRGLTGQERVISGNSTGGAGGASATFLRSLAPHIIRSSTGAGAGSGGGGGGVRGAGGSGGGILIIECSNFNFTGGTISANGSNGGNASVGGAGTGSGAGGGGGGGGGTVVVVYDVLTSNTGTLQANGGNGGNGANHAGGGGSSSSGGAGGGGGGGYTVNGANGGGGVLGNNGSSGSTASNNAYGDGGSGGTGGLGSGGTFGGGGGGGGGAPGVYYVVKNTEFA